MFFCWEKMCKLIVNGLIGFQIFVCIVNVCCKIHSVKKDIQGTQKSNNSTIKHSFNQI